MSSHSSPSYLHGIISSAVPISDSGETKVKFPEEILKSFSISKIIGYLEKTNNYYQQLSQQGCRCRRMQNLRWNLHFQKF